MHCLAVPHVEEGKQPLESLWPLIDQQLPCLGQRCIALLCAMLLLFPYFEFARRKSCINSV